MRTAIALILQQPKLAQFVELSTLTPIQAPGHEVLKTMIANIQENPDIATAQLLEHWRDDNAFALLNQLASLALIIPAAGRETELRATISKLLALSQQSQIDELLAAAKTRALTGQEKIKLQQLIAEQPRKNKLESGD